MAYWPCLSLNRLIIAAARFRVRGGYYRIDRLQARDTMSNMLLYSEARRIIARNQNGVLDSDQVSPWTGSYPHAYPEEIFEEIASERSKAPSAYEEVLGELFDWPTQLEPEYA